jgi:hypothetical protein
MKTPIVSATLLRLCLPSSQNCGLCGFDTVRALESDESIVPRLHKNLVTVVPDHDDEEEGNYSKRR